MDRSQWSEKDLEALKKAQSLAYYCVLSVEGKLKEGMSEKKVAQLMREFMSDHDVERYFHGPFVWFGERTMLHPRWSDEEFLPTDKVLKWGMPLILDIAPIVEGYAVDIGYATTFGPNTLATTMMEELRELRELIPFRVNQGVPMDEIYREIDAWIAGRGYQSCHHHYPAGVIGHLVDFSHIHSSRVGGEKPRLQEYFDLEHKGSQPWDDRALTQGFGESAVHFLLQKKASAKARPEESPYWNARAESHHRPATGVWAVEPHFGRDGVGVKFEELLVVTPNSCYWLDDQVPHVLRWNKHPYLQPPVFEVPLCP